MKFLDAEDRAAIVRVIEREGASVLRGVALVCTAGISMLLLASVAGLAVQAFRFTSGW